MAILEFIIEHDNQQQSIQYDTENGFEFLKIQLYSVTSVPPENQEIFGEERLPIESHLDLLHLSCDGNNKLYVYDITKSTIPSAKALSSEDNSLQEKADEEFARKLQAMEDAQILEQQYAGEGKEDFKGRILPHLQTAMMYEDPIRQDAARNSVPISELDEKAAISLAKEGNLNPNKAEERHAFLLQMLFWFKESFRWVNEPPCERCGCETVLIGMGSPTRDDLQFGAGRVELYRCNGCVGVTRFPRYNDPMKLVETRRGRCGEWANCFTLYCRALGYEARYVLDFTDHVWTECFSDHLSRWMHLDPCEGAFDQPLLYEKGWNKKLSYVIAFSRDGVYDVTKRYSKNWQETLGRRQITRESNVKDVINSLTATIRSNFSLSELACFELRDKQEQEELEKSICLQDIHSPLPGRQSGSKEWRLARAEIGSENNDSSNSHSCPWRTCVDNHVGKIYKSIGLFLLERISTGVSITEIVDELKTLHSFLHEFSGKPFRSRTIVLDSKSCVLDSFGILHRDTFTRFLEALNLKSICNKEGNAVISTVGNPVVSAMALPVASDIIAEIIGVIDLVEGCIGFPVIESFADSNRICGGKVQSSGEQLSSGIVTSAFDGLSTTKWEEPEGGKGSSMTYRVNAGSFQRLAMYQFTSANDAPERDPKDWVLEGSNNEGKTWFTLDTQISQFFDKRYMRKTFILATETPLCNAFRFRFISVRDNNATNRLQIARIDLFAKEETIE